MRVYKILKDQYLSSSQSSKLFLQCWTFTLLALIGVFIYGYLQQLVVVAMHSAWVDTNNIILTTLVGLTIIALIYICIVPFILKYQYPRAKSNLNEWPLWLETLDWLLFIKGFQLVLAIIVPTHVNTSNQDSINRIFYSGHVNEIFIILMSVLMAPLIEEFIFRWLAFRLIRIPWLAYTFGTIGFTILHGPQSFIAFLIYLSMAIALETNFYRNGFWGSYALHFMINLTAVITMLFL